MRDEPSTTLGVVGEPLRFKYKGSRTYIHGSDIYDRINNMAPSLAKDAGAYCSHVAFRRFAKNDCALAMKLPAASDLVAEATIRRRGGIDLPVWLRELQIAPVGRYEFDEESLVASPSIEGNEISGVATAGYTTIETVIALTKKLNYALVPYPPGKWVLGQLELPRPLPQHCQRLMIRRKSVIGGRFSANEMWLDGELHGTMRFIVGSP